MATVLVPSSQRRALFQPLASKFQPGPGNVGRYVIGVADGWPKGRPLVS